MVTVPASAVHAAAEDKGVTDATARLQSAHEQAAGLAAALDEAAASYEAANAHRVRLDDEIAASARDIVAVDDAVRGAEDTLQQRVAEAYKHPAPALMVTDALLLAPDAGSALHRAALFSRLTARTAQDVADVRWAAALTRTDAGQQQIIAAGAEASADQWDAQADRLREALDAAQDEVLAAEDGVEAAKLEAQRRAAAAEAARLAAASVGGAPWSTVSPPPSVDGKTCPVGTPNGFIDSWGYPRSGGRGHEGVDMFAPMGTPLYAVADGSIYRVYNNTLGGLAINLIDEAGNMYYYAHLSAAHVTSGQKVTSGQIIGAVGDSGNARGTPPHLHWQFHPGNGSPVNPYPLAYALCRG
jgi:murein DD-endopeptidase MepM/ murein hydrolase activator NlpD